MCVHKKNDMGRDRKYSQTRLIRTLLIRHFRLIRRGNLKTSQSLLLTPMLNQPLISHPC